MHLPLAHLCLVLPTTLNPFPTRQPCRMFPTVCCMASNSTRPFLAPERLRLNSVMRPPPSNTQRAMAKLYIIYIFEFVAGALGLLGSIDRFELSPTRNRPPRNRAERPRHTFASQLCSRDTLRLPASDTCGYSSLAERTRVDLLWQYSFTRMFLRRQGKYHRSLILQELKPDCKPS